MLQNEVFGPAICFKFLDGGNDPIKFWNTAAEFCNSKVFGSLSLSVVVSPGTIRQAGKEKFEEFIYRCQLLFLVFFFQCFFLFSLKWGTVGVNLWAAFINNNPFGTWGAPPGRHTIDDIQVCCASKLSCVN